VAHLDRDSHSVICIKFELEIRRLDKCHYSGRRAVLLWANLTNTFPSNQTIRPYVEPFINPSIIAANGTGVWAWDPPEETWPNLNVTSGQSLSQRVDIPTTNLRDGLYTIEVAPLSSYYTKFSENFNLTLRFSVQTTVHFG
jgi:hypothetical protein